MKVWPKLVQIHQYSLSTGHGSTGRTNNESARERVREERIDVDDISDEEDGAIEVQAEEEGEVGKNFEDTGLELIGGDREGTLGWSSMESTFAT